MADGGTRMTLSSTTSAEACEAERSSVVRILGSIGKAPLLAQCGQSTLRLTPFAHGTPPKAETLRYRVQIPGEGGASFSVQPLAADAPCTATAASQGQAAVYCTRSAQKPLPEQ